MSNIWLGSNGKVIKYGSGVRVCASGLPAIAPYTLRVEFVDTPLCQSSSFDPTQGTGDSTYPYWQCGTWTHVTGSIYDWTYQNHSWCYYYRNASASWDRCSALIATYGDGGIATDRFRTLAFRVLGANLSNLESIAELFRGADNYLTSVALFDTSKVKWAGSMFNTHNRTSPKYLTTIPNFDFSGIDSNYTDPDCPNTAQLNNSRGLRYFAYNAISLTSVPDITIPTDTSVHLYQMFYGCKNVESGALALYNKFNAASWQGAHTYVFSNCGSNTTTGAAELAQIPSSWGGTGA